MRKFINNHKKIIIVVSVLIILLVGYTILDYNYLRPYTADSERCKTNYNITSINIDDDTKLYLPSKSCYIGKNINSGGGKGDYYRFMVKSSDNLEETMKQQIEEFNQNNTEYKIENYSITTVNNIRKELMYYVVSQ